jgi:hypothetical protein
MPVMSRHTVTVKPDLYSDLITAGSLAAALNEVAVDLGINLTAVPGNWADPTVSAGIATSVPDREPLHVVIGAEERVFILSGWSRGVQLITGSTSDLRDVVNAGAAWGDGTGLQEMRELLPFLRYSELAEAHERGPAHAVDVQWKGLLERPPHNRASFRSLVEAAHAEPRLRQLYPFTSMWTLCFSGCTGFPYAVKAAIVPLDDGRYGVHGPAKAVRGDIVGEADTPQGAVALAVAHLPTGLGPAIAGSNPDR